MVAALCGFPARPRLRPHASPAPARRYERRRPEKTPLHKIVSEHLESWLEWRDQAERPVPGYVEEELRAYLERGILCFGFGKRQEAAPGGHTDDGSATGGCWDATHATQKPRSQG